MCRKFIRRVKRLPYPLSPGSPNIYISVCVLCQSVSLCPSLPPISPSLSLSHVTFSKLFEMQLEEACLFAPECFRVLCVS